MGGLRELSFRLLHRAHLQRDVRDEVRLLHLRHGAHALETARVKLRRRDLTSWGRLVLKGAVGELSRERRSLTPYSHWRPPWRMVGGD